MYNGKRGLLLYIFEKEILVTAITTDSNTFEEQS
jgi:hypothetical protein